MVSLMLIAVLLLIGLMITYDTYPSTLNPHDDDNNSMDEKEEEDPDRHFAFNCSIIRNEQLTVFNDNEIRCSLSDLIKSLVFYNHALYGERESNRKHSIVLTSRDSYNTCNDARTRFCMSNWKRYLNQHTSIPLSETQRDFYLLLNESSTIVVRASGLYLIYTDVSVRNIEDDTEVWKVTKKYFVTQSDNVKSGVFNDLRPLTNKGQFMFRNYDDTKRSDSTLYRLTVQYMYKGSLVRLAVKRYVMKFLNNGTDLNDVSNSTYGIKGTIGLFKID